MGSFIVLGLVVGRTPQVLISSTRCSKRISLLRLRIVVFVVLQSIRLVFIMVFAGFYCSCTRDIAGAVPAFKNPLKSMLWLFVWWSVGIKKPGPCYSRPRLLLLGVNWVTSVLNYAARFRSAGG